MIKCITGVFGMAAAYGRLAEKDLDILLTGKQHKDILPSPKIICSHSTIMI